MNVKLKISTAILITVICVNFKAFSQTNFTIGISNGMHNSTRIINRFNSKLYYDYRNEEESSLGESNFNLFIKYNIKSNGFSVGSGVGLTRLGYEINERKLIDPCFSPATCGYESILYRYNYDLLRIPFNITYEVGSNIKFYLTTGSSIYFSLSECIDLILRKEYEDSRNQEIETKKNQSNYNKINFSFDFGIGIGYEIIERFYIYLQPEFSYLILSYENTDLRDRVYNISLFENEDKTTTEKLLSYGISLKLAFDF
ncbi:MAG: hypothetical protein ACLFNU_08620 [Bacteroidales bacterium]